MAHETDAELGTLLARANAGDAEAASRLFALLYDELRAIAGRVFRGQGAAHTLQPTAVLHEAWLKLAGASARGRASWNDRAHFLNLAARAMRQVLVNHARDRKAAKRGGGDVRVSLAEHDGSVGPPDPAVLDLDAALTELAALDERQARLAELRLFGGLTNPEIAEALGVAVRTVELDWAMAKRWLAKRLGVAPA
jgi:RNA polymerase sigma factor (TIGR02999 family)